MFVNQRLEAGASVRKVQVMRSVLSAALPRAVREELVTRNVARHTELPEWHRNAVRPWTAQEAKRFIAASRTDLLHNAFVLLIVYGLRRGPGQLAPYRRGRGREALGLAAEPEPGARSAAWSAILIYPQWQISEFST